MNRLLIANFARIKTSKLYWGLCCSMIIASLAMTVYAICIPNKTIDSTIDAFVVAAEITSAIFISMFFGTEYSDKTIRNKLIIGYGRRQIYLANLITSVVCAIGLAVSYMLPVIIIGFSCVGLPAVTSVKIMAVGLVTLIALCSVFTMVSMVYTNKAGATVVNLMLALVMSILGVVICTALQEPEFIQIYEINSGTKYVPNPRYLTGAARSLMQVLANISPSGQAVQYVMGIVGPLWALPLYSIGICVICTAVGMVVFSKKDIK